MASETQGEVEDAHEAEEAEPKPEEKPVPPEGRPPPPKKTHSGGRKANPTKENLSDKVECGDCSKTISKHAAKYTHKCQAKKKTQVVVEQIEPNEPHPTPEGRPEGQPKGAPAPKAKRGAVKHEPPPAVEEKPRRLLDLEQPLDHNHPDVHHVVHSYMKSLREQEAVAKRERYRRLLGGRI